METTSLYNKYVSCMDYSSPICRAILVLLAINFPHTSLFDLSLNIFAWSRQKVNLSKIFIFYLSNISYSLKCQIQDFMYIYGAVGGVNYFGHNFFMHISKSREFHNIIDTLTSKIESWKTSLLSKVGKSTYTKTVLQAVHPLLLYHVYKYRKTFVRKAIQF